MWTILPGIFMPYAQVSRITFYLQVGLPSNSMIAAYISVFHNAEFKVVELTATLSDHIFPRPVPECIAHRRRKIGSLLAAAFALL